MSPAVHQNLFAAPEIRRLLSRPVRAGPTQPSYLKDSKTWVRHSLTLPFSTCREYMAGRRREARASGVALGATLTKLSGQDQAFGGFLRGSRTWKKRDEGLLV